MNALRNLRRIAVTAVVAVLATMFWSAPAQAHEMRAEHGDDWAVLAAHHFEITVNDSECDGHRVWAVMVTRGGSYSVEDTNGCQAGYGRLYSPDGSQVSSFYVCENTVGCSATVRVT